MGADRTFFLPAPEKPSVKEDIVMRKCYATALSVAIAAVPLCGLVLLGPGPSAGAAEAPESFKEDVLPIFQVYCVACHHAPDGEGYTASGLDLTCYQGVMTGTKYGTMIVPGDPEYSN